MTFTSSDHTYVGTARAYLPQGFMPYQPEDPQFGDRVVLRNGDTVDVLSAWTRDYLPPSASTLLYVRSRNTGECTHVIARDLPLCD